MNLRRVWIRSPNYTSGHQGRRLLVVHSSEGAQTYQSLGNFFANSANQVSSHVGIDNERGVIGEYVGRGDSAWTAGNANMVSVQAELCTPSGASNNWSRNQWLAKDNMLRNLADWLREESAATGIPLTLLTNSQAQGSGRGICEHKQLGSWGGGHVDCGPNFPMDYVMDLVRGGTGETGLEQEENMFYLQFPQGGDDSTLVFTNAEADGNHRLRFGCQFAQHIRIDQQVGPTVELVLGYDQGAQGFKIEKGCKFAVVHLDEGDATRPIAACIST